MRWVVLICFVGFIFCGFAQKWVIIQTGRPMPVERNNAFRTIGKPLGITFTYDGGDVYNEAVHGIIDSFNSVVLKNIQKDFPFVTMETIYSDVEKEMKRQEEVSNLIKVSIFYQTWKHKEMANTLLLFDRKRNENSYYVYRIFPVYSDKGTHYEVGQQFVFKLKKEHVRAKKKFSAQLPFSFPENGIH